MNFSSQNLSTSTSAVVHVILVNMILVHVIFVDTILVNMIPVNSSLGIPSLGKPSFTMTPLQAHLNSANGRVSTDTPFKNKPFPL